MILTCPNCATRFGVPEGALQPTGRTVRCSRCAHLWFVSPSGEAAPPPLPALLGQVSAPQAPEATSAEPAQAVEAQEAATGSRREFDPALAPAPSAETGPLADARTAARAQIERESAGMLATYLGWAAVVVVVAALAAAIYFHEVIAAEYPATRHLYRATPLMPQMNHDGLRMQRLTVEPDLGKVDSANPPPVVTVSGEVLNESWVPRTIKTLQGHLRDPQGQDIQRWDVSAKRTWLWPGEATTFRDEVPLQGVRPFDVVIKLGPLE